ncbi:hypothetical protein LDENG_00183340, partial [Lucifuga dentata]
QSGVKSPKSTKTLNKTLFTINNKGPYYPFSMFEPNILNFHTLFKLNKKRGVNVCLHRGI